MYLLAASSSGAALRYAQGVVFPGTPDLKIYIYIIIKKNYLFTLKKIRNTLKLKKFKNYFFYFQAKKKKKSPKKYFELKSEKKKKKLEQNKTTDS